MRVLVLEDDADIRRSVAESLRADGFAADEATSVAEADLAVSANDYDVIVVDRGLPDGEGAEFVEARRAAGDGTPALFLTARDSVDDKVDGFRVGGDDYLVKPFAMAELLVRIRALGRRGASATVPPLRVGDLVIDRARAEVRHDDVVIPLTSKERCILGVLAVAGRHRGQPHRPHRALLGRSARPDVERGRRPRRLAATQARRRQPDPHRARRRLPARHRRCLRHDTSDMTAIA